MKKRLIGMGSNGELTLRLPDGSRRAIESSNWTQATAIVALDCSVSMAGSKLDEAKKGIVTFAADATAKGYLVGIVAFDTSARLITPPQRGTNVAACVRSLVAGGSTNLTSAIAIAAETLGQGPGLRAIVIATDGAPDNRDSAIEAAQAAKQRGIQVIAIGTEDADRDFLRVLASGTDLAVSVQSALLGDGIAKAAALLPPGRTEDPHQ